MRLKGFFIASLLVYLLLFLHPIPNGPDTFWEQRAQGTQQADYVVTLRPTGGPYGGGLSGLAFDPANPDIIYAGNYKSIDGGQNWKLVISRQCSEVFALTLHPQNPSVILEAGGNGVCRTVDAGQTWSEVLDLRSVEESATAITYDPTSPKIALVGTSKGRLFKSTNGGLTWFRLPSITKRAIGRIIINPVNSDEIFLATGTWYITPPEEQIQGTYDGVVISQDGGGTWKRLDNELVGQAINGLTIAPTDPKTLYATTTHWFSNGVAENGVYKSVDGGTSWLLILKLEGEMSAPIAVDPTNENTAYTILTGDVWKTTDGGDTWRQITWPNIEHVYYTHNLEVLPSNPNTLYTNTYLRGFMKSTDKGEHWQWSSKGVSFAQISSLFVDPHDRNLVMAGTYGGGLGVSKDGGASWTRGYINTTVHNIYTIAENPQDQNILYAGVSGFRGGSGLAAQNSEVESGVYKSVDGGETWRKSSDGLIGEQDIMPVGGNLQTYFIAVDPVEPNVVYAGTTVNGIFKSEDAGNSWHPIDNGIPQQFRYVRNDNPSEKKRCERGELGQDLPFVACYRFATWNSMSIFINPHDHHDVWYTTLAGLFRSRDGGENWALMSEVFRGIHTHFMEFDPEDSNTVYVGTHKSGVAEDGHEIDSQHGLFITRDGGKTWSKVSSDGPGEGFSIRAIAVDQSNSNNVYVATATGEIFTSHQVTNQDIDMQAQGQSWSRATLDGEGLIFTPDKFDYLVLGSQGKVIYGGANIHGVFRGITHFIPESPADISVTGFHSPSEVEVNKEFSIQVAVDNLGGQDGAYSIALKVDGREIATQQVHIPHEGVQLVTFQLRIAEPGEHQVSVNDLPPKPIRVSEMVLGPDLAIVDVQISPPFLYQGVPIKITAIIKNQGNQDYIGHFNVSFQMDGQELGTITGPGSTELSLMVGEATEVSFYYWLATELGSHQLSVVVDANNLVKETDETNNMATIKLSVSEKQLILSDNFEAGLGNWEVQGDWYNQQANGKTFLVGKSPATLRVRDQQVKDFVVEFDVRPGQGGFGILFRENSQGSYEFGFHPDYLILWHHPSEGEPLVEDHRPHSSPNAWHHLTLVVFEDMISVYLDHEILMEGKDEHPLVEPGSLALVVSEDEVWFDNIQVSSLSEVMPPDAPTTTLDLAVTQLEMIPEDALPGDTVQLIATIENQGKSEITQSVSVQFSLDGKLLQTVTTPAIGIGEVLHPGERVQVQAQWQAVEGKHQLEVIVDPAEQLSDLNRENNKLGQGITVIKPKIIFEDDFENIVDMWQGINNPRSCWKIAGKTGNHFLEGTNTGQCDPPILANIPPVKDSLLDADFYLSQGGLLIYYRMINFSQSYVVVIERNRISLKKFSKNSKGEEISLDLESAPLQPNQDWHHFRIVGIGPKFRVYVDNILQIAYTDPDPILSGRIGFEILQDSHVNLDNIKSGDLSPA